MRTSCPISISFQFLTSNQSFGNYQMVTFNYVHTHFIVPLEIYFKTWTIKKYSATFEERMAREGVFGEILALLRGNYIEVWGVQMRHFGNYGVTGLILSLIAAMLIENHREEQKLRGDSI